MNETKRAIALFVKEPKPGYVKTRLCPPLAPDRAAGLARAFLLDSVAKLQRVALRTRAELFIFFTPAEAAQRFATMLGPSNRLRSQSDGDLTQRLRTAYVWLRQRDFATVCFVGADSPTLPEQYIEAAFEALDDIDSLVVGPASDGGYYLLGLAAPHLGIFDTIEWSTSKVFAQTCAAAGRLGLRLTVLPEWYDVDDAASLRRLTDELFAQENAGVKNDETAPCTRAFLCAKRS